MVSHTVSYARIFALNTVHVILSGVFFNLIPGIIDIPFSAFTIFGIVIIPEFFMHDGHAVAPHLPLVGAIVGTIVVGMLEGLLAFMHTLRLHYVEWFSKFYHGDGIPFKPFVTKRIHTVSITSGFAQSNYPVP
jgi:vacuolar-type H+-ATPase subunit I/STV1